MTTPMLRKTGRRAAKTGILAAVAAATLGVFGAGMANADPVEKDFTYKGSFPIIGEQQVAVHVETDIPASATRGETVTAPVHIDVDAGQNAGDGLRLVGTKNVSGDIKASITVTVSDGQSVQIPVALTIVPLEMPAEGPFTFEADGTVEFQVPGGVPAGPAEIALDPDVSAHLATDGALGEFDNELTFDPPDQDGTLGTVEIK
ncbi:hypothetical protein FB471_5781 [Amycolatopsis cihanbeyliensis]|uniref:DUF6801 domain-containing protein n=2 Tax=Amycolatopsis cihanbeyliensis TaxID=1128664 RepID=A0A542DSF9_AMYCI|nr:hypothetical protein FB471_5781 [Amycolatopsis cihanbeyliensis]